MILQEELRQVRAEQQVQIAMRQRQNDVVARLVNGEQVEPGNLTVRLEREERRHFTKHRLESLEQFLERLAPPPLYQLKIKAAAIDVPWEAA